jgi:predicted O-linked N-acetylglucosamine transferase (SPINDLY family)
MPAAGEMLQAARALHMRGDIAEATRHYRAILALDSRHFEAWHLLGIAGLQTGQPDRGEAAFRQALAIDPASAKAHSNLGKALGELGRVEEAVAAYRQALALDPGFVAAHVNLAVTLFELRRFADSATHFDRAVALDAGDMQARIGLARALRADGRAEDAVAALDAALALDPGVAEAHALRGLLLHGLGRLEAALAAFDRAVALRPEDAGAQADRAMVLLGLQRPAEALAAAEAAAERAPRLARAQAARGAALKEAGRLVEALRALDLAVGLDPGDAEAQLARGAVLMEQSRHEAAAEALSRALSLDPGLDFAPGALLHSRLMVCDWRDHAALTAAIAEAIRRGERAAAPFPALLVADDPALHRAAAESWAAATLPAATPPVFPPRRPGRIRLGYLSADLRSHAVAYLMAEVFERHDRNRFEVIALSLAPAERTAFGERIRRGFDRFLEVGALSDAAIAARAREEGIDILIDLGGHTRGARAGILRHRAAPIQVTYLGFLGTLGSGLADHLVADPVLVGAGEEAEYAERILALPCYQANDTRRPPPGPRPARAACGLPAQGFVFCCHNAPYKLNPAMLDSWARILGRVPGAVLWLLADDPATERNLRREAAARGIAPQRLVFARRAPREAYVDRMAAADLFLDTLPYAAGTTASDALWAGLPVLTRRGRGFAGRMGASLLQAIGLPELIADSAAAYEELAVALATDPAPLAALRERLAANRATAPLFDAVGFTRALEDALAGLQAGRVGAPG